MTTVFTNYVISLSEELDSNGLVFLYPFSVFLLCAKFSTPQLVHLCNIIITKGIHTYIYIFAVRLKERKIEKATKTFQQLQIKH